MATALLVDRLTKVYAAGLRALDALELRVPAGSFFGLLGPNGAGRTTLLREAARLVRAPARKIFVFGGGLGYLTFVLPGVLVMTVASQSFANSSTSFFQARNEGYLDDVLTSPLTAWQVVGGWAVSSTPRACWANPGGRSHVPTRSTTSSMPYAAGLQASTRPLPGLLCSRPPELQQLSSSRPACSLAAAGE